MAESETKLAAVVKMKQVGVGELEQVAVTGHQMAGVAGAK